MSRATQTPCHRPRQWAGTRRRQVFDNLVPNLLDRVHRDDREYVHCNPRTDMRGFGAMLIHHLDYIFHRKSFNRWVVVVLWGSVWPLRQSLHVRFAPERTTRKGASHLRIPLSFPPLLLGQALLRPVQLSGQMP